jgi:hypothetical protein
VPTFSGQVSQSSDDAREITAGTGIHTVNNTGVGTNIGQAGVGTNFLVFLRFQNVTIPQGTTISAATFSPNFTSASNTGSATINGEAADDSATSTTTANSISSRSKTTASASWNVGTVASTGFQVSPDISSVIQEIVNRGGWASGNALSLLISVGSGSASGNINLYDQSPSDGAELAVTYTAGGGGPQSNAAFFLRFISP